MHVIAEAGTNHNGDLETARRLVDVAATAGADSVKFQLIHPERLYLPAHPTANGYEENPVVEARRAQELSEDAYRELADYCRKRAIDFSASVFDIAGAEFLADLGVRYIKVASSDLDNIQLVRAICQLGPRVVLSTGMATLPEIDRTLSEVEKVSPDLVLLHCVSVYPAALEDMNLPFIEELKQFGYPVGLSDHTRGTAASAMALAIGATWFEKHFTLDREQEGFDHAYALEPAELEDYVRDLAASRAAVTPRAEKVGAHERTVAERARRSIYAARDLHDGDLLTEDDLLVVRPKGPLAAADFDRVIGRRLSAPLRRYEPLTWEVLS